MTTDKPDSILSRFQLTAEQRAAVVATDAAISVTAGAGSGKTRALVGRYLALLGAGRPLRSLIAITFTDKAAREMRNRIRALTAEWLAEAGATAQQPLWADAYSALDSARISTIHGLCAVILRSHPAEAGLDPAFAVLDGTQGAVWQARAVEAGLVWAGAEPETAPLFDLFKEAQLRRLLAGLLQRRLDAAHILGGLPANILPHWEAALNEWAARHLAVPPWQNALDTLTGVQAATPDDKLEEARRALLHHWAAVGRAQAAGAWDDFFEALLAMRGSMPARGGQKGNWAADDLAAARDAVASLRDHFDEQLSQLLNKKTPPRWELDCRLAELLPRVQRVFQQTQTIYHGYKSEAHALDFDDLEQMTAHLLTSNAAVRARWQQDINALLLVDEFQDTNQRQRKIVYALAGFAPDGPPSDDSAAPSSLFVVGDAKQSIYRFRGADVTVFRDVQADIRRSGGALIDFDLTFRAHRPLVELTNALLSPLMPAAEDSDRPYDVPFSPLTAFRGQPAAHTRPPYLEFHLGLGENKDSGRQAAAVGLARHLQTLREAGQLEWQDVALLFRASTAYGVYEDALEQAGIPYVTIAGRGFFDRPEVRDLLNALAALADPGDDLALAGLLRSPLIGLSDAALHHLRWRGNERRSFWAALHQLSGIEGLSADDLPRAAFARELVAWLHQQVGRVSVAQLLKTLLDETRYRAALRLAPGGERLRRNVDKLLVEAHRSGLISVAEFLETVETLHDVGARESEAPTEAGGAVQLMTIHKAKGLEFPVVVLADAGYSGGHRADPFYLDPALGLALNLPADEGQPAIFRLAAGRETEQAEAEARRLLYVAVTRAQEKLIISGDAKLSTAKSSAGKLLLSGWLQDLAGVVGLAGAQLAEMPVVAESLPLDWQGGAAACVLHPPPGETPVLSPQADIAPPETPAHLPDLLTDLFTASTPEVDDKLRERESDPPPRVWRVVPPSPFEVPAWVVGSLTHTALRYWRFPGDGVGPKAGAEFAAFLRPFALEAGLTDSSAIDTALRRVRELLARFQAYPLYSQLAAAERHHELPFSVAVDGQTHSGIIDLLFRSGPAGDWSIAEFKTDRLPPDADLLRHAQEKGYTRQVALYRQAIGEQLGASPQIVLVFLNVGRSVREVWLP